MSEEIDLTAIPELKGMLIIKTQKELKFFLEKLHPEFYSHILKELHLPRQFTEWMNQCKPGSVTFFAVFDEKDNHRKNDGWGHYKLFKCTAIRDSKGEVRVFKDLIDEFMH